MKVWEANEEKVGIHLKQKAGTANKNEMAKSSFLSSVEQGFTMMSSLKKTKNGI